MALMPSLEPSWSFRIWTVVAYVVLFIVLVALNRDTPRLRYQGVVYSAAGGTSLEEVSGEILGSNADLSYPIKLDGVACNYSALKSCGTADPEIASCCESLADPETSGPESTVPTLQLYVLSVSMWGEKNILASVTQQHG